MSLTAGRKLYTAVTRPIITYGTNAWYTPITRPRDGPGWVGFCAERNPAQRVRVGSAVQPSPARKPAGLGPGLLLGSAWHRY